MNLIVTLTIIGFLLLFSGLFILASIPFSLHFGGDDIPALLISGLGTFLVGLLLFVTNKLGEMPITIKGIVPNF